MLVQEQHEYTIEVSAEASRVFYVACDENTPIEQVKGRAIASAKRTCEHLDFVEEMDFEADVWEDRYEDGEYPVEVTIKACDEHEIEADSAHWATKKAIARFENDFVLYDWENYEVNTDILFSTEEDPE